MNILLIILLLLSFLGLISIITIFKFKSSIKRWIKNNKKKVIGGVVTVSIGAASVILLPVGDPPISWNSTELLGYELLDNGTVFHMWNQHDSYYFNRSNGVQFSNHYEEYWTTNVLMLGYYAGDSWNLLYRTDELSGFTEVLDCETDDYINATLWKDLSYGGYDFRVAIRYHLKVNDSDLTIIPYIKNLGIAIPFQIGFGWEMKDIKIDNNVENDQIRINGTSYLLNQTLDIKYTNITRTIYEYNETTNTTTNYTVKNGEFYLENINNATGKPNKDLYLKWNPDLDYLVWVKSRSGQYNAPVTLFIKVGTLGVGQEKSTELYWHDATLIDSYSEANRSLGYSCSDHHPSDSIYNSAVGQSFTCDGAYKITSCKFYMMKLGSPTGMGHAVLYAHSGTYGTSSLPTGEPLATSDDFDVEDLTSNLILHTFAFTGAQQYLMSADTKYCIEFESPATGTIDSNNRPHAGLDHTSPTHDGSGNRFADGLWRIADGRDICFYVYGEAAAPENNPPTLSGESPTNTSTDISITPSLYVICTDSDAGDTMNATWRSNSSGAWVDFASNSSISTGTNITQSFTNASEYSTTYWWSVNLSDGTDWVNETYSFTTAAQKFETTIRNDGEDYFIWLGSNVSAWDVAQVLTGFDEANDNISIWRNGTWGGSAIGNWVTYHGDTSGTNFNIYTFDVIQVYLTDSGTQTFNMTANPDIDYSLTRNVTLINEAHTKGGNYTGYTNSTSTNLSSIATSIGMSNYYYLSLWNETNYQWDMYIVGFGGTNSAVHQYDVVFTKVSTTRYWEFGGI